MGLLATLLQDQCEWNCVPSRTPRTRACDLVWEVESLKMQSSEDEVIRAWCPYKKGSSDTWTQRNTRGKDSHMTMGAEPRVTGPQAMGHQEPSEVGRDKAGPCPGAFSGSVVLPTPGPQSSERVHSVVVSLQVWSPVTAAPGTSTAVACAVSPSVPAPCPSQVGAQSRTGGVPWVPPAVVPSATRHRFWPGTIEFNLLGRLGAPHCSGRVGGSSVAPWEGAVWPACHPLGPLMAPPGMQAEPTHEPDAELCARNPCSPPAQVVKLPELPALTGEP